MNVCVKRPYTCWIFRSESLSGYACMPVCNLPCLKGTLSVKICSFLSKRISQRNLAWWLSFHRKALHCDDAIFSRFIVGHCSWCRGCLETGSSSVPDGNARWRATRPSFPCPLPARQGLRRQRGPRRSRRLQRPSMTTSSVFVLF